MTLFLGNRKVVELKNQKIPDMKKYLKNDGSDSMMGNLDLGNYAINNLKTYPENNKNAASKKYVDDEFGKLLDLDGNRNMNGDLNLNDNAIIGIGDISADNSVPSKKFVKDEIGKLNTKITRNENVGFLNSQRDLNMQNELNSLKANPKYSHYSNFIYQNPVANVYKSPYFFPLGFPDDFFWISRDYSENTTLTILALNADADSTLPTTNVNFSVEGIFYNKSGGYTTKVIFSGKNIHPYRITNTNAYYFDDDSFTIILKDLHNNWRNWCKFKLKVSVPWSGNEIRLTFFVHY